jgi:aspartyl-tRNA(Asn)/glutamyl-tRNA(Gln) amidotransferase subunit B
MSAKYYSTIGLEIHAELKTNSKMFCSCRNNPDETNPNTNICPVCMAHPGALPVPNMEAIKSVIKVGLSINGNIANFTEFDRKNYFYPDIPKGYQISQYKYPIVSGGKLGDFDVTRIHLEEDTANSKHDRGDFTLVDFNRAGVPLMELVTEPHTFETPEEASRAASKFAKELQLLLWYLGVSDANMEKGEMRVEANISISPDKDNFGTKVEVKNLNSFRSAERAILFELERMKKLYESGKESEIVQETRGWDEIKQSTFSQRSKENAQDYRYFPEPDIPKFYLKEIFGENYEKIGELPETPEKRRTRFKESFGIKDEDIETYVNDPELGAWFEEVAKILNDKEKIKTASNYTTSDLLGIKKNDPDAKNPKASSFAELIEIFVKNEISSRGAKDILAVLTKEDISPKEYAEKNNLIQKNDEGAIKEIVQRVIDANAPVVAEYKAGKEASIQFLVGQVMKESKGSANPGMAMKILKELLG